MPAATLNAALVALHDQSLSTIGLLQQSLPNSYAFMINISVFFDPRYVFLIYAPILFALNKRVGHRMIVALTCCEWSNQVLKWLLAGERPYWYVHEYLGKLAGESGQLERNVVPDSLRLRQFPVTCELGAGSPSGHAMVTATVWYVLIDAYLKGELKLFAKNGLTTTTTTTTGDHHHQSIIGRLIWASYMTILALVGVSRVYLACHFPHQCLCGALLGCALAKLIVDYLPMDRLRPLHFCLATLGMFASAMATYALLQARGFDPLWSVGKAMRWCEKPEHIHLDTTPFYSMMRYLGFCLGAGLAYDATRGAAAAAAGGAAPAAANGPASDGQQQQAAAERPSRGNSRLGRLVLLVVRRTLATCLSIGFGQLLLAIPLSRANLNLYYAISFLLYTIFAYSFATLVPDLVKSVLPISVNFNVQTTTTAAINAASANQPTRKKKISIKKLL